MTLQHILWILKIYSFSSKYIIELNKFLAKQLENIESNVTNKANTDNNPRVGIRLPFRVFLLAKEVNNFGYWN